MTRHVRERLNFPAYVEYPGLRRPLARMIDSQMNARRESLELLREFMQDTDGDIIDGVQDLPYFFQPIGAGGFNYRPIYDHLVEHFYWLDQSAQTQKICDCLRVDEAFMLEKANVERSIEAISAVVADEQTKINYVDEFLSQLFQTRQRLADEMKKVDDEIRISEEHKCQSVRTIEASVDDIRAHRARLETLSAEEMHKVQQRLDAEGRINAIRAKSSSLLDSFPNVLQ